MKRKWFVLFTILATLAVGTLITDQITQAQRPDRPMRGEGRRGPGGPGGGRMNPTGLIENSWAGLTFAVKVEDETLLKARPIHQKAWDDIHQAMKEARETRDFQGVRDTVEGIRNEFNSGLKAVLTEDQLAKLKEWQKEQMERQGWRGRRGEGRPGEGRHGEGRRGGPDEY